MTYTLLIGDRSYSSWSLRGWLPFAVFRIPVKTETVTLYSEGFYDEVAAFGGARTVPVVRTPEGGMLSDSLAIAWHLTEAFPDKPLLPEDPVERSHAQSLIAEMHTGFTALRSACPMNLRTAWSDFEPSETVKADLARIDSLWCHALERSGGPFLFGAYSLADAFFAPVATRIATYGLPVSNPVTGYVRAHLDQTAFRQWRAMGFADGAELPQYEMRLPRRPFPGQVTVTGRAVGAGPAVNDACPYSGLPVTHFAEIGDRTYGFCNAFCRDKTVADPEAWPDFMAIYLS